MWKFQEYDFCEWRCDEREDERRGLKRVDMEGKFEEMSVEVATILFYCLV